MDGPRMRRRRAYSKEVAEPRGTARSRSPPAVGKLRAGGLLAGTRAEAEAMAGRRRQRARRRTLTLIVWTALAAPAGPAACATAGGGSGSSMPANDMAGGNGQIDQTYREIYQPGRGTDF